MRKGRISNGLQRMFIFGSVAMLMVGLVFNSGNLSSADGTIASKVEKCALQSITITAGEGETAQSETYTGGLKSVIVGKDVSWNDYFLIRTIGGVEYITNDTCTSKTHFANYDYTVNPHDHVSGYIYLPDYTGEEVTNPWQVDVQTQNDGAWVEWVRTDTWTENQYINNIYYEKQIEADWEEDGYYIQGFGYVKLNEDAGYYDVKFQPRYGMVDGESPTGIYVRFAKQYAISYDLADGAMTGAEEVYTAGTEYTLPIPTKEGYDFAGWTGTGLTEPTINVVIPKDAMGDRSYTATWKEILDISTCDITLTSGDTYTYTGAEIKPVVMVKNGDSTLVEGKDYKVTYANNVKVADKNATNAPMITITGISQYNGTKVLTYTIKKATPSIATIPTASEIEEGQKLSDSVLSGGKAVDAQNNEIKGTFAWKDGSVSPTIADSGVTKYKVTFSPTDAANYETVETDVVVKVNKKPEETPTPETQPEPEITVGDEAKDKDNKATYKVTKSTENKVEVSYVAPAKKTKKLTIPATVTLVDGTKAKVTSIAAGAFKKNTTLQEVTISANVKTIGKEAFSGCKNLKKVKSAKNVTSIGKNAFANCKKLTSVAMNTKITSIGEKAFYNCKSLEKITIPKNVKSIGKSAFQNCKKLKNITINSKKLTKSNVKKNAFKGIYSKAKFNVPNSKRESYKSMLKARGVGDNATIK